MRYLPLIAVMLLAGPAMAGESTIEKTTPPTELETCTIQLRGMADLMAQLQAKLAPVPRAKPDLSRRSAAKAEARPATKSRGCKPGRWRHPTKKNHPCGVWS